MSDSNLFKPGGNQSGFGQKAKDKGQFANPPAYPEVSGFTGPSTIKPHSAIAGTVQKTPSSRKGRV